MSNKLKVILGCDGCAYEFKEKVEKLLIADGFDITDAGCKDDKGYYIDAAEPVCQGVQSGAFDRGVLICGTGQGMNITANKHKGIRSAICYDIFAAKMTRADNNANVLCTGAWVMTVEDCVKMIETWLISDYYDTNIYGLNRLAEFEKAMKTN